MARWDGIAPARLRRTSASRRRAHRRGDEDGERKGPSWQSCRGVTTSPLDQAVLEPRPQQRTLRRARCPFMDLAYLLQQDQHKVSGSGLVYARAAHDLLGNRKKAFAVSPGRIFGEPALSTILAQGTREIVIFQYKQHGLCTADFIA